MADIDNGTNEFSNFRIKLGSESPHFVRVSQYLRDDYNGKKALCDLEFKFSNEKSPWNVMAHSQVVSTFSRREFKKSPYTMTTIPFEIENERINRKAVRNILSWIYNGKVDFKLAWISSELEFIKLLDVPELRDEVEARLRDVSKNGLALEVLIAISKGVSFIPHSYTIEVPASDELIQSVVEDLHNLVSQGIAHRKFLKLTPESIMVMIASKISDSKKVDVINLALKWIHESKTKSEAAAKILRTLTFGAMTYEMLVNFRNSLVQTAIPVRHGKCVRILMKENKKLEIVFGKESDTAFFESKSQSSSSSSFAMTTDANNNVVKEERPDCGKEVKLNPFTDSEFEYINAMASAQHYLDREQRAIDVADLEKELQGISEADCRTAVSFSFTDLKVQTFCLPN